MQSHSQDSRPCLLLLPSLATHMCASRSLRISGQTSVRCSCRRVCSVGGTSGTTAEQQPGHQAPCSHPPRTNRPLTFHFLSTGLVKFAACSISCEIRVYWISDCDHCGAMPEGPLGLCASAHTPKSLLSAYTHLSEPRADGQYNAVRGQHRVPGHQRRIAHHLTQEERPQIVAGRERWCSTDYR